MSTNISSQFFYAGLILNFCPTKGNNMPNGGTHICGHCRHFKNDTCVLRNEIIEIPYWTTCRNWNTNYLTPNGVMLAIVCEVKNRAGSYTTIPYFNGLRVDSKQDSYKDTTIVWESRDGQKLIFKDVAEYLSFYEIERMKKMQYIMGAVAGDTIGSVYEFSNIKSTDFPLFEKRTRFTDDTVLTIATMDCILNKNSYTKVYQSYGRKYPKAGYAGMFYDWIFDEYPEPYGSWGNGSAMRVSPVGWAYNSLDKVLLQSKRSAEVTHNHPEGIRGAQATASAIFLARTGKGKSEIKQFIEAMFDYDLNRKLDEIRPSYQFDVSCQGSVPKAIIAFLESTDFESAIRLAISIGGDSDTIACIAGALAEAFYQDIPEHIFENTLRVLPSEFIEVIEEFSVRFRK